MATATRSENNTRAWWFLAPALALIGVFFFLPVGASLLLSITDFDIYAIADRANVRFVGLRNYAALLDNPPPTGRSAKWAPATGGAPSAAGGASELMTCVSHRSTPT